MNSTSRTSVRPRGVVAVIFRQQRLLIIRRAMSVAAPGTLCLPGGGIESGESEAEALVREMQEELAIAVEPLRRCWHSVTPLGTHLAWWLADLAHDVVPVANPHEVAEVHWMTRDEIRSAVDMLPSLPMFIDAWERGEVDLSH
jgi:8-oxo-dGTP pyrophosphatase MutT (NUDIX family)